MICSMCEEKAEYRCNICWDVFCAYCGKLHKQSLKGKTKLEELEKGGAGRGEESE